VVGSGQDARLSHALLTASSGHEVPPFVDPLASLFVPILPSVSPTPAAPVQPRKSRVPSRLCQFLRPPPAPAVSHEVRRVRRQVVLKEERSQRVIERVHDV